MYQSISSSHERTIDSRKKERERERERKREREKRRLPSFDVDIVVRGGFNISMYFLYIYIYIFFAGRKRNQRSQPIDETPYSRVFYKDTTRLAPVMVKVVFRSAHQHG